MELMAGIFELNIDTFKAYAGSSFLMLVYLVSLVYVFVKEKKPWIKLALAIYPVTVLIAFFFPPVRLVYDKLLDGSETFYRVLWLVPFGITMAYALTVFFSAHKRAGLFISALLIVVAGQNVYDSAVVSKATNPYHLRQYVINVCDMIAPGEDEERIWVCVPVEMVHQVRQYNSRIMLVYGRDSVEPGWEETSGATGNRIYELMCEAETVDMEELTAALEEAMCRYLVLGADRSMTKKPTECGWEYFGNTDGYYIYENPDF